MFLCFLCFHIYYVSMSLWVSNEITLREDHEYDVSFIILFVYVAALQLSRLSARRRLKLSGSLHVLTCLTRAFFNGWCRAKSSFMIHQYFKVRKASCFNNGPAGATLSLEIIM